MDQEQNISLAKGLFYWTKERFPIVNVFSAFLLYAVSLSVVSFTTNETFYFSFIDCIYAFGLTMQFLLLRVLDEHKDFEHDKKVHPERVLQKGWVNLGHLKFIGILAIIGTLIITVINGSKLAYISWGLMAFWTFLMSVEFFCKDWLRKQFLLYSISHMLVLPLMILWSMFLIKPMLLPIEVYLSFLSLVFINGLIYEIIRKMKGSEEEHPQELTFSSLWGVSRSSQIGIFLHISSFAIFCSFCMKYFNLSWYYFVPSVLGLLLSVFSILNYIKVPNKKSRKSNEGASALYALFVYLSVIVFSIV